MRRLTWLGVVAVLGGVLVLGCFDAGEERRAGEGAFGDLLRFVPDEAAYRERVTITDLGAIREHYGLEPKGGTEGWTEVWNAAGESNIQVLPIYSGVLGAENRDEVLASIGNWEQGFGFGVAEIDRALTAGFGPPRYLYAAGGRFDPEVVEATLAACSECQLHEVREHAGKRYLAWGDDLQQTLRLRNSLPAFDALGRGGLFVFTEEHVLRANWADGLTGMIDGSRGTNSPQDRAEFAEVAQEADALGLFILTLTDLTQDVGETAAWLESWRGNPRLEDMADAWTPDEGEVLLRPYLVLAVGRGIDEEGVFTAIILGHASEEVATENVGRLKERIATIESVWGEGPWRELFEDVEVSADGVVLIAKVRGPNIGYALLDLMDPLLLHE